MDEQNGNLADETAQVSQTAEMTSEPVAHQNEELRKRRSTRIMQAVPLAVTGVDALGRPFTERTSTLIINCHGCRYQSKHYVLKNMWVTLEVPHPEAGQAPRTVRGRVAWIQRPRTVRQLFQVALELETPGNAWGIAFPPPDWFAAPAAAVGIAHFHEAPHDAAPEPSKTAEIHLPLTEPEPTAPQQDNLRVFPAPASATDASLQLARQMARLMADAKQQLQASAREFAAQSVGVERRISAEEWEQRIATSREQLAQQVAGAMANIQSESETRWRAAHHAAAEALQRELPGWIAPQLEQLARELTRQISERGAAERDEHSRFILSQLETLHSVCRQAEETASRLHTEAEAAKRQISDGVTLLAQAETEAARLREVSARAQREAFNTAAHQTLEHVDAALAQSRSTWQGLLDTELAAAERRLRETVETAASGARDAASAGLHQQADALTAQLIESTRQHAASTQETVNKTVADAEEHLAAIRGTLQTEAARHLGAVREAFDTSLAAAEQKFSDLHTNLRDDLTQHAVAARDSIAAAAAEAERHFVSLRDSFQAQSQQFESTLARAVDATDKLENFSARIDTTQRQALAGFESQIDDVLTLHRNELHRSSETLLGEINARIHSTFIDSCQLAISRFDQQVDGIVQPHISRTEEAIHRLAGSRSLLDAALTLQQDRIRASADEAFAESLAHFRDNLGGVEQLLQDAETAVTARNLADYESKIADLKHQTVDDLMKSAEWYEKKAQTQIQNFTEKTVEQAENNFRAKAGEISGVFASELDSSSRGFIQHTQTQMEEVVRDAFEQSRALFAEAAETTTAAFTDEIQRQARGELDGFVAETQRTHDELRGRLETAQSEAARRTTSEQEAFLRESRARMSGAVEAEVSDAHRKAQSSLSPLLDSWKATVEAHRNQMQATYQELSQHAAEQHRTRLENVSNQWMLATVASLNQQSREAVASIAAIAEDKLRETCGQVFATVGESLRERLQQIAAGFSPKPDSQTPNSPQSPMSKTQSAGGTGSGS